MTTPPRLTTPSVAYQGDGVTRTFPIPFDFVRAEDVKISVSPPVYFNVPRTIRGEGDPNGGTLDLGYPLPPGNVLTVYRDPPIGQDLDLAGEFHPPSLEAHLDRLYHVVQRLNGDVRLLTNGGTAHDGRGTVGAALRTYAGHGDVRMAEGLPSPYGKDGHLLGLRERINAHDEASYEFVWLPPYSGEDEAGNAVVLDDASVTGAKLAAEAVTTPKLADGAVTPAKLAAAVLTDAWSGDVDAGGHALFRPTLKAARERTAAIADDGAFLDADAADASIGHAVLTGDRTLRLYAEATAGSYQAVRLYLKQDTTGGRLVTWPSSIRWAGGSPPTLSLAAGLVDVVHLGTLDDGATWEGFVAAQGLDGLGFG